MIYIELSSFAGLLDELKANIPRGDVVRAVATEMSGSLLAEFTYIGDEDGLLRRAVVDCGEVSVPKTPRQQKELEHGFRPEDEQFDKMVEQLWDRWTVMDGRFALSE